MLSRIISLRQQWYIEQTRSLIRKVLQVGVGCVVIVGASGCRDLSNPSLPAGTQSPDTYLSRAGGLMLADAAERQFGEAWRDVAIKSGMLTDELTSRTTGAPDFIDLRDFSDAGSDAGVPLYKQLHKLRGQARFARDVLAAYASDMSPAVRGRLFAFEAYAEIWLADMYCSGVPLSILDFQGDYTNLPPSSTDDIYAHAVTLFDSALALSTDSVDVQTLARTGKGRALLAQGRYADAEGAVSEVQMNDAYKHTVVFHRTVGTSSSWFWVDAIVSDHEGFNGLPFRSSGDPRTEVISVDIAISNGESLIPLKYGLNGSVLVTIASGIDASLIKAEAALQRTDTESWLSSLNSLRTNSTYSRIDTIYTGVTISSIDTLWQAGTGGVDGLHPLADPGNAEDRITLHFTERAAWLFVTGQRQADLRRLVRKYKRVKDDVYPTGPYSGASALAASYGNDIDLPIPAQEYQNPLFKGCLNRD